MISCSTVQHRVISIWQVNRDVDVVNIRRGRKICKLAADVVQEDRVKGPSTSTFYDSQDRWDCCLSECYWWDFHSVMVPGLWPSILLWFLYFAFVCFSREFSFFRSLWVYQYFQFVSCLHLVLSASCGSQYCLLLHHNGIEWQGSGLGTLEI